MKAKLKKLTLFDVVLMAVFLVMMVVTLYPLWHCIIGSIIPYGKKKKKTILLWPDEFTMASYEFIFKQGKIISPMRTTALITVIGTLCTVIFTAFMAYGLSKRYPGSKFFNTIVILTMFIDAGMIPNYLLFRKLGILNQLGVYILPALVNTFYLIILRTNFSNFPQEIEEAARIDGSGEYNTFFRIILPLNTPVLATVALFTAINFWNTYEPSVYYVTNYDLKTLQDYLYLMISNTGSNTSGGAATIGTSGNATVFSENIKLANTVIAILPIMVIYPFLQKYFTSGLMIGAVKG